MLHSESTKKLASNLQIYEGDELPYGQYSDYHRQLLKLQYARLATMQNFSKMEMKDLPSDKQFITTISTIEKDFKQLEAYLFELQLPPLSSAPQAEKEKYKTLPQKIEKQIETCEMKISILRKAADQINNSRERVQERIQIYNSFQQDAIFKYLLDEKSAIPRKDIQKILQNDLTHYLKTLSDNLDADELKIAKGKCRNAFTKVFDDPKKIDKMTEEEFKYQVFHLWQILNSNISTNLDKKQNTPSIANTLLEKNLKLRENAALLFRRQEEIKSGPFTHSDFELKNIDLNLKKAKLLLEKLHEIEFKIIYEPWNHRGSRDQELEKLNTDEEYNDLLKLIKKIFTAIDDAQKSLLEKDSKASLYQPASPTPSTPTTAKQGIFGGLKEEDLQAPVTPKHVRRTQKKTGNPN